MELVKNKIKQEGIQDKCIWEYDPSADIHTENEEESGMKINSK